MGTIHPQFQLSEWVRKYPLAVWKKRWRDDPQYWVRNGASSPLEIAIAEQVRWAIWPNLDREPGVPCDVFTWAWGEPENPAITKIGGIPYFDCDDEWPIDFQGKPMGFVCQVNFQDSFDLVGKLPGDVLLFFSSIYTSSSGKRVGLDFFVDAPTSFHCRWAKSGSVRNLRTSVPNSGYDLWPLHGVIHRTFDVPSRDRSAIDETERNASPIYEGNPPAIWWATKIGGVPRWEQGQFAGERGDNVPFLCQVTSDRSRWEHDPYINHPNELTEIEDDANRRLTIWDEGSAYMFFVNGKIDLCGQS